MNTATQKLLAGYCTPTPEEVVEHGYSYPRHPSEELADYEYLYDVVLVDMDGYEYRDDFGGVQACQEILQELADLISQLERHLCIVVLRDSKEAA